MSQIRWRMPASVCSISAQVKPMRMRSPSQEPYTAWTVAKAFGPEAAASKPQHEQRHAEIERSAGDAVGDRHDHGSIGR